MCTHTSSQYTSASQTYVTARASMTVGIPKNIQVPKLISSLPLKRLQSNKYTISYNDRLNDYCTHNEYTCHEIMHLVSLVCGLWSNSIPCEHLLTFSMFQSAPGWAVSQPECQLLRYWLQKQFQSPAPCSNAPQCHSKAFLHPQAPQAGQRQH